MRLVIKSNFKRLLEVYVVYLTKLFQLLNLDYKLIGLPIKRKVFTLLKSPHVNKKAKEQFELKTYKKLISIKEFIPAKTIKEFIKNKPPVVQVKIIALKGK